MSNTLSHQNVGPIHVNDYVPKEISFQDKFVEKNFMSKLKTNLKSYLL